MAVDEDKLNAFLGQFVQDLGATVQAGMVVLGHRLGLYRAMAGAGPLSPPSWPSGPAPPSGTCASGWPLRPPPATWPTTRPADASASPRSRRSSWPTRAARRTCRARSSSPWPASRPSRASPRPSAAAPGSAGTSRTPRSSTAARCSSPPATGPTWSSPGSRPWTASRPSSRRGGGSPTSAAGMGPRPSSWPGPTRGRPSSGSTTTSGRSTGPARRDGTWLLVEPAAGDRVEDNLNPVGRLYYGFSVLLCVPNALSQQPTAVLGNQAGEARTRELVAAGGFGRFRRAAETPFNLVYEARP